jgi:DNA-binding MltR family transcriptional regulator
MNITDADSAYLSATAEIQEWEQEFMAEWFEPQLNMMKLMVFQQMDEAMRAYMKKTVPEEYAKLEQLVKKMTGGKNVMVG